MLAAAVQLRGVGVTYGDVVAVESATAQAPAGCLVCLVGVNGSGKSTLLKALIGSVPHSGSAAILGVCGRERRRRAAYVPQREAVEWNFPISVIEVAMMGRRENLRRIGWDAREARAAARTALARLQVDDLADRAIGELSGGQQQRVMLARAVYSKARVLLLDEPLSGVDPAGQGLVLDLLAALCAEGRTVLMATHDLQTSARVADRVWGVNRTVVADVGAGELLDAGVLQRIYGDHLVVLPDGALVLGDQAR